jgi:hypothetical protein
MESMETTKGFSSGKCVLSILNLWRLLRDPSSYFILIIFIPWRINIIYKFIFIQNDDFKELSSELKGNGN